MVDPTATPDPSPTPTAADLDPQMLETLVSIDQRLGVIFVVFLIVSVVALFGSYLYIVARMRS